MFYRNRMQAINVSHTTILKFSRSHSRKVKHRWCKISYGPFFVTSLWIWCVFYTHSTSHSGFSMCQVLQSHTWLVAILLNSTSLHHLEQRLKPKAEGWTMCSANNKHAISIYGIMNEQSEESETKYWSGNNKTTTQDYIWKNKPLKRTRLSEESQHQASLACCAITTVLKL